METITGNPVPARLKTWARLVHVIPAALNWRNYGDRTLFRSADEVVIPHLGTTVMLKRIQHDLLSFHYEIVGTGGLTVGPKWVEYFDTDQLVPSAYVRGDNGKVQDVSDQWCGAHSGPLLSIEGVEIVLW